MKFHTCALMILSLIVSVNTFTQLKKISGDPHLPQLFATEAAKSPGYIIMRDKLIKLIKTATPQNTNAAAVKNLLASNTELLKSIYQKAGIEPPTVKSRKATSHPSKQLKSFSSILAGKFKPLNPLLKIVTPPYSGKTIQGGGGNSDMTPDTSLTKRAIGKTAIIYSSDNWHEPMGIGIYGNLFLQNVKVPPDPTIVAAEIKLEYSYLYTGWDTYGSIRGLCTLIRLQGTQELPDNPMPVFNYQTGSYFPPYLVEKEIQPMDSIETDFDDFTASGTDSLTLQRYITPGQNFTIEYGLAFPYYTVRGNNGCYHYAEMKLKKITIRYMKAQAN